MPTRSLTRALLLSTVALAVVASIALPARSQTLPTLSDVLDEVGAIDGLAPLSPVLDPVAALVRGLEDQIDDVLVDVPLVNTLALQGEDAVDAGIAFSQATFPEGASTAIVSREDLFADGFSSGGFQGAFDAPLLFTDSDDLDRRTGMELMRLGMDSVTILGGEDALHPLVVSKLQVAGLDVTRVGGPTRVETAVEAAGVTAPDATTAVLTRAYPDAGQPDSQAYADLLAAGPYAAENGWPILMTPGGDLHPSVAAHLADGFTDVVIIGGTGAVSQGVEAELAGMGLSVDRVAGDNRFATAVAIAEARGFADSSDPDAIVLAEQGGRDDVWAPGFASSAFGSANEAPVLLTDGPAIPAETLAFVMAGVVDNLTDGGPVVVCASFVSPVACEAVGLLLIGDLTDALDVLDGVLADLPLVGEILTELGLLDLLPDALQDLVDDLRDADATVEQIRAVLAALVDGDLAALTDALGDIAETTGTTLTDLVDGLLSGGGDGSGGGETGGGILDPILEPIGEGDDGILGGDGSGDGPLDPVLDEGQDLVEDTVGDLEDVVDSVPCIPTVLTPCS